MPPRAVLTAEDAAYAVGRKDLVADVSLAFEAGGSTAIVGPNGSGKTTLLRLLGGVLRPSRGRVLLDGRPIGAYPRARVARWLSYLPQHAWTDFDITVADAVTMGRLSHVGAWRPLAPADVEAVSAALARVDLDELRCRTLPTLSGGERQRVFIARALAQGSEVLLLDEPTSALDVGHQLELMEILVDLHREGRTVVAAMHDLHLVWDGFPRTVLLDRGRVVAAGDTRDVLTGEAARAAFGVALEPRADGSLRVRAP